MLGSHHVVQNIGAVLTMTLHCPLSPQEELEYLSLQQIAKIYICFRSTVKYDSCKAGNSAASPEEWQRGRKSEWIKQCQILRCFKTCTNIQSHSLTIVVIIIAIMMNSGGFRLSEGLGWKKNKNGASCVRWDTSAQKVVMPLFWNSPKSWLRLKLFYYATQMF